MAETNADFLTIIMFKLLIFTSDFISTFGYVDLSDGKASSQTLTYPCTLQNICGSEYIARNAVDRNTSTCTRNSAVGGSSPDTSVWWRVDLGDIYSIHSVRILFKDFGSTYVMRQRGRFAGFSIYLSNSTKREDWVLCYKDGPNLPPLDFSTTCIKYGRYVIYYNERLKEFVYPDGYETPIYTALCEVIVHGCEKRGVYGVKCNVLCPVNCQEQRCHIANGTCLGCKPGWTGDTCKTPCPNGWYGIGCKSKCTGHCKNNFPCHTELGNCVGGCASGWMGDMCNKECEDGTFGPGCNHNCSGNCWNNSHCNKRTGSCDMGCNPGYTEISCNKMCTSGKFGIQCREICSGHCLDGIKCNHIDGNCNNSCHNGYNGDGCNKPCERGLFGSNCSQKCSVNCRTSHECNNIDGSCVCSPGWTGSPHCNKECDLGFYGENCQKHCRDYCVNATCSRTDGICLAGYIERNKFEKGEDKCTDGTYAKKYHTVSGIFGAYTVVTVIMFAVLYLRRRILSTCRKTKNEKISTQIEGAEEGHSDVNADVEKDQALYQELGLSEDKCAYQELQIEQKAYENLELTTNWE